MKKTSRILSVILAIIMVISIIPITASAEDSVLAGTCGNNITWALDKSTGLLVISGSGKMQNYNAWHDHRDYVKEIIIQDGITSIANTSFYSSDILAKVTIPDSVKTIGSSAFFNCPNLETLIMGNGITSIGDDAFGLCRNLKDVFYSGTKEQWKAITMGEFNSFLKNATIHYENVVDEENHTYVSAITKAPTCTEKGVEVFVCSTCNDTYKVQSDALGHTKVSTPAILPTTTQTGCSYDERCSACGEIYFEGQIIPKLDETSITGMWGDSGIAWVFDSSTGTLTLYGKGALGEYSGTDQPSWLDIKQVVINEGITEIGGYVFYGCTNIESVIFPQSIEKIKFGAFSDFCDVDTIYYKGTEAQWNQVKENSNNTGLSLPTVYFEYGVTYSGTCGENLTWHYDASFCILTISGSGDMVDFAYTDVPWNEYRSKVKEIVINDGVTSIGDNALICINATKVTIPDSVVTIGDSAFRQCYDIQSITIPDSVKTIGTYAFFYCQSLTDIVIPESVETIGKRAFDNCFGLKSITVDNDNQYFSNDEYGVLFDKNKTKLIKYPSNRDEKNYVIPDGVTEISEYAFNGCFDLESLTIPRSLTKLSEYSLSGIDDSLIIYYDGTKEQWDNFKKNNIDISDDLDIHIVVCSDGTVQPYGRFGNNLIWSFDTHTNVLTISGEGNMNEFTLDHFYQPNTPWKVYINSIKKVVFEDGVRNIGGYAFHGMKSLESITIGNSLTSIGEKAFYNCQSITSVVIPINVTSMGDDAFKYSGVTDVYYEGTEEQWIDNFVYPDGAYINLNPPLKDATIHYNYHIHRYSSTVTAPTCTEQGYTTYTCECGDAYDADYVDATGHTPANPVEENYIAPTCTANGSKDVVVYCSVCDEEISRETVTLDATGRVDNNGDGYCDACNELLDPTVECDCNCHKSGIKKFFFQFALFFQRIFGSNKTCECGVAHY